MRGRKVLISCVGAALALTAVFLVLNGCGNDEEQPLAAGQWKEIGRLPANFSLADIVIGADGRPYIGGYSYLPLGEPKDSRALVYRWRGSRWEEAFKAPDNGTFFDTLGVGGGALWAGGHIYHGISEIDTPYIVRYASGQWEEITIPSSVKAHSIRRCYPVGRDFCWLVVAPLDGGQLIYSYDHGVWKEQLTENRGNLGYDLAVTAGGKAYVHNARDNQARIVTLAATDDRGANWRREVFMMPPGWTQPTDPILATAGEALYVSVECRRMLPNPTKPLKNVTTYATIIYRRDQAPAGSGNYEQVFVTPESEMGANDFRCMAFKSGSEGYAAGSGVGARFAGNSWRMEEFAPGGSNLAFNFIAAAPDAYWGIGFYLNTMGGERLFQAP